MKLLFLTSQISGNGGIPRFNRNLNQQITNIGSSSKTLSLNDPSSEGVIGCDSNKTLFLLKLVMQLVFFSPEKVVVGHLGLTKILKVLPGFLFKNKHIVSVIHGIEAWEYDDSIPVSKIQEYWAVSKYTKNKFCAEFNVNDKDVNQIFNTIPNSWEKESVELKDENFFLSVARLDKSESYKGVDLVIEAVHGLKSQFDESGFKYIIVAHGDDLDRHKKLVIDFGLDQIIEFKSKVSDETLLNLYSRCSGFLMPSRGEGFGIVFLEAMAYKKACLGSVGCGSEDVIEDERTGYLIVPEVDEIRKRIEVLIDDKELRTSMGKEGYRKLHSEFTEDKFNERIRSLLLCAEF